MGKATLRAEVRRELERGRNSLASCVNHLVQAAKLCEAAKRPESGDTLQAFGEMIMRIDAMINEFRDSI